MLTLCFRCPVPRSCVCCYCCTSCCTRSLLCALGGDSITIQVSERLSMYDVFRRVTAPAEAANVVVGVVVAATVDVQRLSLLVLSLVLLACARGGGVGGGTEEFVAISGSNHFMSRICADIRWEAFSCGPCKYTTPRHCGCGKRQADAARSDVCGWDSGP